MQQSFLIAFFDEFRGKQLHFFGVRKGREMAKSYGRIRYRPNRLTATTSRATTSRETKSSSILQTELLVSRDIFASSEIIELST